MPVSVTLDEAQTRLRELLARLIPGEELLITDNDRTVARLIAAPAQPTGERKLGSMRGSVLYMAPDFDDPLDEYGRPVK